jgi:hypothetical protein
MTTLFLACAGLGSAVLLLQIILGLLGFDHGHDPFGGGIHGGDASMGEGLELLSVRSIAAAVAFFGIGGYAATAMGVPGVLAAILALAPGAAALIGTAFLMHQVMRLESSGTIDISRAVGEPATVYLTIPAKQLGTGKGKVHVALQGRTIELQAVSPFGASIPTGAPVIVVSVVDSDTVEVVPTSIVEEVLHDNR